MPSDIFPKIRPDKNRDIRKTACRTDLLEKDLS
jgi:hypothetical protein